MRIWDISPKKLCRNHLLGEHRELHAIWVVLVRHKKGYSRHPETLRWKNKLAALYARHELLVMEMTARGYRHYSSLGINGNCEDYGIVLSALTSFQKFLCLLKSPELAE